MFRVRISTVIATAAAVFSQLPSSTHAQQVNVDTEVFFDICYDGLDKFDTSPRDQIIRDDEYLQFVKDFGGRSECLGTLTELPIELRTVWNQLACECSDRTVISTNGQDNSSKCCLGNNAQLPVHGVLPDQPADVEQQQFLRQVCVRTDQAIISFCGPPPQATVAPIPAFINPTPLGTPTGDALPIPLIIGSSLAGLILLLFLLCCCRRRRWCFCAGKGYDSDDSSSEDDDDSSSTESGPNGPSGISGRQVDVEEPAFVAPTPQEDKMPRENSTHMIDNGEFDPLNPEGEELNSAPNDPMEDGFPRESSNRFGEGGEMEEEPLAGPSGATTRVAMSEEEEDDEGGRTRWNRSVQDAEYEDIPAEPRPTGYEQYDLPDEDGPGIALRHVEKAPPPPEVEEPYELEHYVPDGGVHIPEREPWQGGYDADGGWMPDQPPSPKSPVAPYRYKYEREEVRTPSPVDTRRFRRIEALGDGAVFDQLEQESVHSQSVGPPSDMFDWVIRETLNTLDQKGDELHKASEHGSMSSSQQRAAQASGDGQIL